MKIAFVHSGSALLPEIRAYQDYFRKAGLDCVECRPEEELHQKADIEWHFMGQHRQRLHPASILVHEYASLSTPPLAGWKDRLKRRLNCRPDYRIFLNDFVKNQLNFTDEVPWGYRDMFFQSPLNPTKKDFSVLYDFIYTGTLEASRNPEQLLNHFAEGAMKGHSLLIISRDYNRLQKKYAAFPGIHFVGPVAADRVWEYLGQARFAINFQPNRKPFSQQTSSKLLEYASCRIPIVTTRYPWVEAFQKTYGGKYFYLDRKLTNFTWEQVTNHSYGFPDLSSWTFEEQFKRSGILEFLHQRTGDNRFILEKQ